MSQSNYDVFAPESGGLVKMWTRGVPVEDVAKKQLANSAALPFIHKWIAAMPDVHWGMGATVGSVIPTRGAIIPAAVGVDIGCGMIATRTSLTANDLPDNLKKVREAIEERVPHGRTDNGGVNDRGAWKDIPDANAEVWAAIATQFEVMCDKHPGVKARNTAQHLGTLGTGNHFIEVCLDEADRVWIMLHSGSRGVGNRIGQYFINLAKEDMRKHFINLPDVDLSYLVEGSDHFNDYVEAVSWAQDFARANRSLMLDSVIAGLKSSVKKRFDSEVEAINCHHNYVQKEHHYGADVWVTRKGAVCAREGMMGIIPGSMGARSYIVRGKGNEESFHSCSHGAGRKMSRGEAKRTFTLTDHKKATEGIECRKDKDVIDETPGAYKDIDAVMAAQSDLVDVVHTLRQVVCVKG